MNNENGFSLDVCTLLCVRSCVRVCVCIIYHKAICKPFDCNFISILCYNGPSCVLCFKNYDITTHEENKILNSNRD